MTNGRLFPFTRIILTGACLFKMSRKRDFHLDQRSLGLSAGALISSKGNSFRSFISVSLFKVLVLLTVTIV